MNEQARDIQVAQMMQKIQESSDRIVELFDKISRVLSDAIPAGTSGRHKTCIFR